MAASAVSYRKANGYAKADAYQMYIEAYDTGAVSGTKRQVHIRLWGYAKNPGGYYDAGLPYAYTDYNSRQVRDWWPRDTWIVLVEHYVYVEGGQTYTFGGSYNSNSTTSYMPLKGNWSVSVSLYVNPVFVASTISSSSVLPAKIYAGQTITYSMNVSSFNPGVNADGSYSFVLRWINPTENIWVGESKTSASSTGNRSYTIPSNAAGKTLRTYVEHVHRKSYGAAFSYDATGIQDRVVGSYVQVQNPQVTNITTTGCKLSMNTSDLINTDRSDMFIWLRDRTTLIKYSPKIRYIKITQAGNTVNASNHIVECMVYNNSGTNVALGKTVTNSCGEPDSSRPLTRIVDGVYNDSQLYAELGTGTSVVTIDLGSEMTDIRYCKLWRYYADNRTYYNTSVKGYDANGNLTAVFHDYTVDGTYVETSSGMDLPLYRAIYDDLSPDTEYSAQFKLRTKGSSLWSNIIFVDFQTDPNTVTVVNPQVTDILADSCTLSMSSSDPANTDMSSYAIYASDQTTLIQGHFDDTPAVYSKNITGLEPNTTYYARFALRTKRSNAWSTIQWVQFTTPVLADYAKVIYEDGTIVTKKMYAISGKNLLDERKLINNANINITTGIQEAGTRTIPIEYIKVEPSTTYTITRPVNSGNMSGRYYDINKNYIGSSPDITGSVLSKEFTTPSNCHYFKFVDEGNTLNKGYQLEKGSATQYEPFIKEITRDKLHLTRPVNSGNMIE